MSKEKSPLYSKSRAKILKEVATPFHQKYKTELEARLDGPKKDYKLLSAEEKMKFISEYRSFLRENIDTKFNLEKKRRARSKHGLKNYLARADVGAISANDLLSSGQFNLEELKKREYFKKHPEHLAGLEDFKLSEKTKMMREARQQQAESIKLSSEPDKASKQKPEDSILNSRKKVLIGVGVLAALAAGTAYYLNRKRDKAGQAEKPENHVQRVSNDKTPIEEKNTPSAQGEPLGLKTAYNIKGFSTGDMKPYNPVWKNPQQKTDSKTNEPTPVNDPNEAEKLKEEAQKRQVEEARAVKLHEVQESMRDEKKAEEEKKIKAERIQEAELHRQAFQSLSEYLKRDEARLKELDELKQSLARKKAEAEAERRSRQDAEAKLAESAKNAVEEREKARNQMLLAGKNLLSQAGVIESMQISFAQISAGNNSLFRDNEKYAGENKTLKNEQEEYRKKSKRKSMGAAAAGAIAGVVAGAALMSLADDDPRYKIVTPNIVDNGLQGDKILVEGNKLKIVGLTDQPELFIDSNGNIIFTGDASRYPDITDKLIAAGYKMGILPDPDHPNLINDPAFVSDSAPNFVSTTPSGANWVKDSSGKGWDLETVAGKNKITLIDNAQLIGDEVVYGYTDQNFISIEDKKEVTKIPSREVLDGISTSWNQVYPLRHLTASEPSGSELRLFADRKKDEVTYTFKPYDGNLILPGEYQNIRYDNIPEWFDDKKRGVFVLTDKEDKGQNIIIEAGNGNLSFDADSSTSMTAYKIDKGKIQKQLIPTSTVTNLAFGDGIENDPTMNISAGFMDVEDGKIEKILILATDPQRGAFPAKIIEETEKIAVYAKPQKPLTIFTPQPKLVEVTN